jgi:hypothetical protein
MADTSEIMTITTTGNEVTLTLTNTAIIMRFTDKVRSEVHDEKANLEHDDSPGWAKALANFALGAAERFLQSSIEYPLADISSIEDRDGAIKFTYRSRRIKAFEDVVIGTEGHQKQALSSFSPADAAAFVAKARELIGAK